MRGVLPGDGAGDHLVAVGRLGAELDVAQGHAVDDGGGGHENEHTQFTLVHRPEVHGEGDGLVVGGRDLDGDSADGAGRRDGILVDGQDQLAVFDLRMTVRVITGGQLHGGLRILDFAVGPGAFQLRQQRGQINRIRRRVVVRDLQRLGRGGSDARPVDPNKLTAAAAAVFDLHHPAATGKDKVAAGFQRHCAGEGSVSGFRGVEFHIAQLVVALVQIKNIHSRQYRILRVLRIKHKTV